jgi:hypothetical protein
MQIRLVDAICHISHGSARVITVTTVAITTSRSLIADHTSHTTVSATDDRSTFLKIQTLSDSRITIENSESSAQNFISVSENNGKFVVETC